MNNQALINDFSQKVLQVQAQRKNYALTPTELRQIAIETGFTLDEWSDIENRTAEHVLAAAAAIKSANYDDAIQNLQQTLLLRPFDILCISALAEAHAQRWRAKGNNADYKAAVTYTEHSLKINPSHSTALKLKTWLEAQDKIRTAISLRNMLLLALAFVVVASVGLTIVLYNASNKSATPLPIEYDTNTTYQPVQSSWRIENGYQIYNTADVSLRYKLDKTTEGIKLDVEKSQFNDFQNAYSYTFWGYITAQNSEITQLSLQFEFADADNKIINTHNETIIEDYMPHARKGDVYPVEVMVYVPSQKPVFSTVTISIASVNKQLAPATYPVSDTLPITWESGKTSGFDIAVHQRTATVEAGMRGTLAHNIELEIHNIGTKSIQQLQMRLVWYDKNNNIAYSEAIYATVATMPPILREQTRLYGRLWVIEKLTPATFGHYTVSVVSVQ